MKRGRIQINEKIVEIHYITNDSKPVMILLHALGSTGASFRSLMERLSTDFSVISVDLPGHGGTDNLVEWNQHSVNEWLEDVIRSLEINNAHIAGHSIGGDVALQFAARFPDQVNSVILLDGGYLRGEAFGLSLEEEINHTVTHCRTFHFSSWKEFDKQPEADMIRSSMHENNGRIELKVDVEAAKELVGLMSNQPTQELLQQLFVPVLLLRSTKPENINPIRLREIERMEKFLKINVIDIPQATHDLPVDQPERVAEQIKKVYVNETS
ncbi:alpha/beta hydrolase [Halobacillus locisalis]|uniref:Alpha/beta hydrolase n=1 Tax=Halobacillus locisalis TaxID=220753 RepID=A0A838CQ26_9BACI|nr:alpha/beta hydrolase [Halobacillus locisalis]MBA2173736.1 alpha/beta hydrolase [Halobacillus locisalis]